MKTSSQIKFVLTLALGPGACGSEQGMPEDDHVSQGLAPQLVQNSTSETSQRLDLDGSRSDIPLAEPTAAYPCDSCEGSYPFKGDGVNIHSCASTSCSVLGLGYRSQRQATICNGDYIKSGFGHIENRNTGVRGWSKLSYVTVACD